MTALPEEFKPEDGVQPVDQAGLLLAAVNLTVVAACVYLITRAIFVAQNLNDAFSLVMALALLAGEAFVMFHSVAYCVDFVYACNKKPLPVVEIRDWEMAPGVAILMPARHEPYQVLEQTLFCLRNIDYPNKTIYFLDDSSDEKYLREAEELALTYGAKIFRRAERHGAKAGIINDCLKTLTDDYVVIFDADQNPARHFLKTLVPVIEANPKLAFVQTPQFYTNTDRSSVAFGANLQHCMFYEYICEGKSERGAMILCGTNAIIRRSALNDIGGLDETSITEDFSTSIDWHLRGWESRYYGHAFVFGEGPTTLMPYLKQQWRWARGNLGVLKKIARNFLTRPFSLTFSQWWEYFATGSYYLIGWAYFLLMLCPLTYIFLRTPSFFIKPEVYLLTFIPYFTLSFTIFFTSMRKRNYRADQLATGVLLSFISFPVYMKAAVVALLGLKSGFGITQKGERGTVVPYRELWPQILMWLVHFAALVWGANHFAYEGDASVLMSMFWVFYHFLLLSSVFYFRYAGVGDVITGEAA
jgi:cellulose synthase (UDP-forming)